MKKFVKFPIKNPAANKYVESYANELSVLFFHETGDLQL